MITERAPAKLNLALHVRARRADGYHELETLFAFVEDGDVVRLDASDRASFRVEGPFAAVLSGEGDNLVVRAERLFAARFGVASGHDITLVKALPVASGVGGGSADAAATLRALARLYGTAPDEPRLIACAEQLGSDVPACLLGRTALGQGRGERLALIAGAPGTPVLLVNPGVAVATDEVFARWDGVDRGPLPEGALIERALAGRNDLEAPAIAIAPVIAELLALLERQPGVVLARMSGSGATCFALFETPEQRGQAAEVAASSGWWCLETRLV